MMLWGEMLEISAEFIVNNPVWVVENDSDVLGFTAISSTHPTAELEHLWVCPKHMQKGVGAKLMSVVKAYCQANGVSQLQIKSDPNAKAFYEKQGAI